MTDTFGQDASPIAEYLRILNRRKWLIALVAFASVAGAVGVAMWLPEKFQSAATILIEEPVVSEDLASPLSPAFADQRLQLIQQRIMTTAKLVEVIDHLDLYREAREANTPLNELADDLRSRIELTLVGANTSEVKNGRAAKSTTAFSLSYIGFNPATTQRVVHELVALYMAENERAQRSRALGTAGFLTGESNRLTARIRELERQLAEFKTKNVGMLPEEMDFNTQLLDRTQNQMLEFMRQAQSARERQAFLQAQLLSLEPMAPVSSSVSPEALSPKTRLRLLKAQYSAMIAKYGDRHPDVVNLRRQIEAIGGAANDGPAAVKLEDLQGQLDAVSQKYGPAHPEVVRLKRELEAARKANASAGGANADMPDNPIYVQTLGQLAAADAEVKAAQAQVSKLQEKMKATEARIVGTPEVERAYVALKRDYDTTVAQFEALKERENQAELAKNLETEQMGEHLSLIEPPPLPTSPISPNRPAIILLGIIVGLAGGIAVALLADSIDGRVYGYRRLASVLGEPPLASIPRLGAIRDRRPMRHKFAVVMISALLAAALVIPTPRAGPSIVATIWMSILSQVRTP
jgi:uncharacterized protein involved in exopolysaccharide biosynthesis